METPKNSGFPGPATPATAQAGEDTPLTKALATRAAGSSTGEPPGRTSESPDK
ncbi:hypothetical protein [Pseudarthrobacter sp. H2]|uniref:hypothetical protein n=1 Tax=Pseudarthrobacter sp. H2 TaxID=3418415 RepID=UPI003CF8079B